VKEGYESSVNRSKQRDESRQGLSVAVIYLEILITVKLNYESVACFIFLDIQILDKIEINTTMLRACTNL